VKKILTGLKLDNIMRVRELHSGREVENKMRVLVGCEEFFVEKKRVGYGKKVI
jgi:hypothetical protein